MTQQRRIVVRVGRNKRCAAPCPCTGATATPRSLFRAVSSRRSAHVAGSWTRGRAAELQRGHAHRALHGVLVLGDIGVTELFLEKLPAVSQV